MLLYLTSLIIALPWYPMILIRLSFALKKRSNRRTNIFDTREKITPNVDHLQSTPGKQKNTTAETLAVSLSQHKQKEQIHTK